MLHKFCKECGKKFYKKENISKPAWFGNKRRPKGVQYCSKECSLKNTAVKAGWNKGTKGLIKPNKGSFKKGMTTWNKGLKGYRAGELNNNWKGGITPKHRKIRNSSEMQEWRTAVFERHDYTCQECNQRGGRLNAHHVKEFSNFKELRFNLANGITLCKECHDKKHENMITNAVLNEHQVRRIRLIREITPNITLKKLGSMFGVHDYTIGDIFRGVTWQGVT